MVTEIQFQFHQGGEVEQAFAPTFRGWCIAELNVWGNNELLE